MAKSMFSPLSRGYAPWSSDLYDVYKNEETFIKDKLPTLEPETHRHGVTVTPRSRAASAISYSIKEPIDGQLNLPKTYLTRKGALVLFTAPEDEDEENQPHDAKQEKIIRLQRANQIIDTSLRLGTSGRLSKAILQFGDEDYDKENASISDEKNKMFLKFLHRIDDRDVDYRSQPGSELSAYLRDLKSRASSRISFSGDTHLPRSREALELRAILRGLQEDNWPINYSQDGTFEQFTRAASHVSSRTASPAGSTTASSRPILSARKLAASVKSLNSYLGRSSSPSPQGLEKDDTVLYQTTISASVTRKHVTSPITDLDGSALRETTFSPQGQKLLRKRSHGPSMTGSSILEEEEETDKAAQGDVNDKYTLTGTEEDGSDIETQIDDLDGAGEIITGSREITNSGDGLHPASVDDANSVDARTILTEGSDGSDLEILYRAGESEKSNGETVEAITHDSKVGKKDNNMVVGGTESISEHVALASDINVTGDFDIETSTTVSEDYLETSTIKVDVIKKPVTGTIQEEGEGLSGFKGHISQENGAIQNTTHMDTKRTSISSAGGDAAPKSVLVAEGNVKVEESIKGKTSILEEVTQALPAEEEEDNISVASSVLIEQDIELPPEEPEEQTNGQIEVEITGIKRPSITSLRKASGTGESITIQPQLQQYTGLTGRKSSDGFAINNSLPDASANKEASVSQSARSTPKLRRGSRSSRPPSQTGNSVVPPSRASSVSRKSPDLVKDSLENLASSSFLENKPSEPETLISKQLDSIGKVTPVKENKTKESQDDKSENKIRVEHQEKEMKHEMKNEKVEVVKPETKEKEKIAKSEPKKTTEKKEDTSVNDKKEKEAKPETIEPPSEKSILDTLKAEADQFKNKKDAKKSKTPKSPPQKNKPQHSKTQAKKVEPKPEEKKDYSDALDILSVQPEEGATEANEPLIVKEPKEEEIAPRFRKKAAPEKEKVVIPDFIAEAAGRSALDSYNDLQKGVEKMSEMMQSELSAPVMENVEGGLTAEELELAKQAMAEKVKLATQKLDDMESPRIKPKKSISEGKPAQGKKGKKKTKEEKNTMEAERARIKEQQRQEKLRRIEEVKALQEKIAQKEAERKEAEREAKDREIEIKLEMERLAKEAEQISQAEEDVRIALAESRKKQREERESRRKAELERKKQEIIDKRERERKAMTDAARKREHDMLAQIEDAEIKRRFQEDEERKLDEEERLAAERLEEEMEEIRRRAEEEEEREREIERMADEEALQRLRDEEAEKDRERRRLAEEQQKLEEEKERERLRLEEEERILLEQRRRREEEEDRMREEEKKRLLELQKMEEEARRVMQQEIERRREAAMHRREKNLERRANLDTIRHGQGVTKPWVFSYFINWPRETYMRPMGEDPKQKKGFRPKPKPKPKPPVEGDKSAPAGS